MAAGPLAPLLDAGRLGLIVLNRAQRIDARHGRLVAWLTPGAPAADALPFLVGYEPALAAIAAGERPGLQLPRLAWPDGPLGERVIAVEALAGPAAGTVLLWLQDATTLAALEQQVLQQRNELALANAALAEARAAAERAHRAKAAFLANVSHDLRSPLQVIIGNAELLAGTPGLDGEGAGLLRDIEDSGRLLLALIGELLEVAELDSGSLAPLEEPVDLAALVERAGAIARGLPGAERRQIEVRAGSRPALMRGDPVRLQRLLTNLLANAVKFTAEHGRIALELARSPCGGAIVTVADDGCGIAPDLLARVFEPFMRHGAAAGSGLGLAVARELAEQHEATLTLRSRLGAGTTAELALPASRMIPAG